MKTKLLCGISLLLISTSVLADTMTLKIPVKAVLMRDEIHSVKINCMIFGGMNQDRKTVFADSASYPLDSFGNIDSIIPIEVNLDEFGANFLQTSPGYKCRPSFLDANDNVVLSSGTPEKAEDRRLLYQSDKSNMLAQEYYFVPDDPNRIETLMGGRQQNSSSQLKNPAQGLKLQTR